MNFISSATSREKIAAFLRENAGQHYCDDCTARATGVQTQAQVASKAQLLARKSSDFIRMRTRCSSCGHVRKTTWFVENYSML